MKHNCPRCGFQTGQDHWYDRNPMAAALAAVPLGIFGLAALLTYPWVLIPALIVGMVWWADHRRRQQAAITARAEHDYRQQMINMGWAQR